MFRIILRRNALSLAFLFLCVFVTSAAFAQTNTPVPPTATSTPGITVDTALTNQFFSQSNFWIETFAPIIAIGIGIAIALAILTFIGKQILEAFR